MAYVFDIFAETPFSHKLYYIDAITGEILNTNDLIFDANTTGTAATRYSGTQTITTDSCNNGYRLHEIRNGVRIETYNMKRTTTYSNDTTADFFDNDNNWTATEYNNSNFDNAALDAHWGLERVYDYWNTVMYRNSLDSLGMPLFNYVHANLVGMGLGSNDNAFWDGQRMTYGDGQTIFNPVTSLDVVAHETGHGIMSYTDKFGISGENGALNEGFSDIWGAVIEHWAAPNDQNKQTWLMGEQIIKNGALCLRSLRSPKTEGYNMSTNNIHGGYPDTYQKTNWDTSSNPDIHINSTVLSHWFYLLSQGGSGTNDLNNSYNVYGIGIDNAAKIVYQAQTVELRNYQTAQYSDVMAQTIQAASDIYGANSPEVMQVQNAWYAVGLETQPSQLSITGSSQLCSQGIYTVNNLSSGATVTWSVTPANMASVQQNGNSVTVTKVGNGLVTLSATINQSITITRDIWAGVPSAPNSLLNFSNGDVLGNNSIYDFELDNSTNQYVDQFNWTVYGGTILSGQGTNAIEIRTVKLAKGAPNYIFDMKVKAGNSCGWSNYFWVTGYVSSGIIEQVVIISLSPNPASSQVEVSVADEATTNSPLSTTGSSSHSSYTVTVVDSYGLTVYSATKKEKKFSIPTSSFRNGIYAVIVSDGTNVYRNKLIVNH